MIDNSELTEDELLATVAHIGEWVEGIFTVEYFERNAIVASEKGYIRWGTQSDDSGKVQKNRVVFLKGKEEL